MGSLDEKKEVVMGNYVLGFAGNDYECFHCIQKVHDYVEVEAPQPL